MEKHLANLLFFFNDRNKYYGHLLEGNDLDKKKRGEIASTII
jgi:hypothetical protein